MHKCLAAFTCHKLRISVSCWVYPSYAKVQQIWSYIDIEITCLNELLEILEILRTQRMLDIVSIWYRQLKNFMKS